MSAPLDVEVSALVKQHAEAGASLHEIGDIGTHPAASGRNQLQDTGLIGFDSAFQASCFLFAHLL